jgi:hypothetical protein
MRPTGTKQTGGRRAPRMRAVRLAGYVAGGLVGAMAIAAVLVVTEGGSPWAHSSTEAAADGATPWQRPVVSSSGLAGRSGVRISQVAVSGAGGLVDLRFQVVDPVRADVLHDAATPPALISEDNGVVVHDLFMGHSHSGRFKGGQTYYLVFTNPGNLVERGSKVTVLLGNASLEHVLVR